VTRPPTDVGASAFNRLKALARAPGYDFNLTLTRYGCERLLYRLSQSQHRDAFMLKGATLFMVWEEEPHRPTRDIDLLGFGEDSAERLRGVFTDVCRQGVEDDGVVFDSGSIGITDIREGQTYQGKRLTIRGRIGTARLQVQVDVELPAALTPALAGDEVMRQRWAAFLRRIRLSEIELTVAVHKARSFLLEPWTAVAQHAESHRRWPPGGPWESPGES